MATISLTDEIEIEHDDTSIDEDADENERTPDSTEKPYEQPSSAIKPNYNFMPHDKNVINFLINEYLLEQNYKMTHITFAEENESLDLEDWDVVGLNRSKPPNLCQLYKYYLNKKNAKTISDDPKASTRLTLSNVQMNTQTSFGCGELMEASAQTNPVELNSASTNTNVVLMRAVETWVNLDHETFDKQKMQIAKLLEKQASSKKRF